MGDFITFLALVFLAFVGFVIYFIFKLLQFVIQAVDLYKDMVTRLDKIIEILSAGPAATANISRSAPASPFKGPRGQCPNCDAVIALNSAECPKCKSLFGPNSSWKVKPL